MPIHDRWTRSPAPELDQRGANPASRWVTLVEAAALTRRSRVTMRRYLDRGRFPNARREPGRDDGRWQVPVEDLLAAGLEVGPPSDRCEVVADTPAAPSDDGLAAVVAIQAQTISEQARVIQRMTAALERSTWGTGERA